MQIVTSTDSAAKSAANKANGKGRQRAKTAAKDTLHLKAKHSEAHGSEADVAGRIATAAYYLAERRGFEPGHELEDWLTAEREVLSLHS
jgi:DUF2934 family protein